MRIRWCIYSLSILLALLLNQHAVAAQGPPDQPDLAIDAAARSVVIEGALKRLNDY